MPNASTFCLVLYQVEPGLWIKWSCRKTCKGLDGRIGPGSFGTMHVLELGSWNKYERTSWQSTKNYTNVQCVSISN